MSIKPTKQTAAVRPTNPDSFLSRLAALDCNQNITMSRQVFYKTKLGEIEGELQALRDNMKNSVSKAIARISGETGNQYSYEFADLLTPSRKLYLVLIVTRVS